LNVSNNINAVSNWWGTTSTQIIGQTIYDSKFNASLGQVSFVPFLNQPNVQAPPASSPTPTPTLSPTPTTASFTYPTSSSTPSTPTATSASPTSSSSSQSSTNKVPEFPSEIAAFIIFLAVSATILANLRKKKIS